MGLGLWNDGIKRLFINLSLSWFTIGKVTNLNKEGISTWSLCIFALLHFNYVYKVWWRKGGK